MTVTMFVTIVPPSGKNFRFLCIVHVLIKHPSWVIMHGTFLYLISAEWIIMHQTICRHGLCIVLKSIIHPCIRKHDISGGNHGSVTWNVHLMERFLFSNKLIFIHSTSNLYATWYDSNFKFQLSKNNAS
jgi:hypothetical protein